MLNYHNDTLTKYNEKQIYYNNAFILNLCKQILSEFRQPRREYLEYRSRGDSPCTQQLIHPEVVGNIPASRSPQVLKLLNKYVPMKFKFVIYIIMFVIFYITTVLIYRKLNYYLF